MIKGGSDTLVMESGDQAPRIWEKGAPALFFLQAAIAMLLLLYLIFSLVSGAPVIFIAFCFFGALGVLVAWYLGRTELTLFSIVYIVNSLAAVGLYYLYLSRYGLPYFVGGSDDLTYERYAVLIAHTLPAFDFMGIKAALPHPINSPGYVYIVSLLYRASTPFGGFHTMVPRLLNCMVTGLIAIVAFRLARRYRLPVNTSWLAGLAVGTLPIMVYTTVHTFRDVITSMMTLWVFYLWDQHSGVQRKGRWVWKWIQTLLFVAILTQLRIFQAVGTFLIAVFQNMISPGLRVRRNKAAYAIGMFALLLAMGGIALVVFRTLGGVSPANLISNLEYSGTFYSQYRSQMSETGLSSYVFNARPPLSFVLRLAYASVTPLPVLSLEPDRLLLSIGSVIQFFFLPFVAIGCVQALRDRAKWGLLGLFVFIFSAMAFITFTFRHIIQFLPYGIVLAAIGFGHRGNHKAALWTGLGVLGATAVLAYAVLKV
jgi:hypothetical protein